MSFYGPDGTKKDYINRQAIINGNFDVWQRGTSFTPASADYTADRWRIDFDVDGGTLPTDTITRAAITPGDLDNSFYSLKLTVNGAGSGFGSDAFYLLNTRIEHGTRLLAGASKTVTLSYYAKSDIADKKIGVFIQQYYGTGGTPSSIETINGTAETLTSSWVKYTHTFTLNTLSGKTFGTDNNDWLKVGFYYMWGDTIDAKVGETTAEDFGGAGDIDIAQVQLCAGSVALPFQPKSFEEEISACQRYFEKSYNHNVDPATATTVGIAINERSAYTGTWYHQLRFNTRKRAVPTVVVYNSNDGTANEVRNASDATDHATSYSHQSETSCQVTWSATDIKLYQGHFTADAEL